MDAQHRTIPPVLALAFLGALSPSAVGQERMDGTALDANLNALGGRVNQAAPQIDFRAANQLITGNVVGGRGFRGTVGYPAEYDFRGITGSDDLFRFRADAAWSDVNFINLGDTYQRLRFGQDIGLVEYRRTSSGAALPALAQQVSQPRQIQFSQLRLDRLAFASSITSASETVAEPTELGFIQDQEGTAYIVSSSSLQGLSQVEPQKDPHLLGLKSLDMARHIEDALAGREIASIGRPFQISYANLRPTAVTLPGEEEETGVGTLSSRVEPVTVASQLDLSVGPQYENILESVAGRFADLAQPEPRSEEEILEELEGDLQRLREHLMTGKQEEAEPELGPGELPPPDRGAPLSEEEERERELELPAEPAPLSVDIEELGTILRHGQRIERLSGGGESRLGELLVQGEERLRAGEYFYAERRFQRALRFMPGHPLATVGLAHSQIGAGLYVPAALTLRSLYSYQPEMIDARYDSGLVPNRPRLLRAVETLEDRLDSTRDRANSAFLLAYVGRLLGDRGIIQRGLDVMAETEPDEPLLALLQKIWLAEEKEAPEK